ncbi:WD repeat-containing protein 46 [Eupeodes corollae]|uniref:WD repeat-containing protein 46 n=1 Tax=Eupeodes corollae TaxID=290404 RepID=UPI00249301AC|nr:WD repeat-containing protein 46 [Eupeodes corollae]
MINDDLDIKPDKKTKNKAPLRYFDQPVDESEVEKIKLKPEKEQKFKGEVIHVEPKAKPLRKLLKSKTPLQPRKSKVPQELLKKHSRGEQIESDGIKTNFFKEKLKRKEIYHEYATEQAARTEILLKEDAGFIIPDKGERTKDYRQSEIAAKVDITTASKLFKLNLDFGPYSMRYTKNGRHLLLGGRMGHVAAFDWITKRLHCEINVMEEVAEVAWLHIETMFACAQKSWVHIYDNQGTELHCVKRLYRVNKMEFLPYHFLLSCASSQGYLSWLDVSIGELVGHYNSKLGDIRMMRSNPSNGVLCVGGGKGVVSMWSPKVREPLAEMLCHPTPISALAVDPKGQHLVTAGLDRTIKVWDVRELSGPMAIYKLKTAASQLDVSQRGVLAFANGNHCSMYRNLFVESDSQPYLQQSCDDFIHGLRFCPYEDILGLSTAKGFQSMIVPGSGEPNYDAREDNPYQTKTQRKEFEVHALLEKIPPELISLNPNEIAGVDVPTLREKVDAKKELFFLKPPQIEFKSRHKMKGRGGTVKAARNKQIVKDAARKEFIADIRKKKKEIIAETKLEESENFIPLQSKPSALDRFKPKKKK